MALLRGATAKLPPPGASGASGPFTLGACSGMTGALIARRSHHTPPDLAATAGKYFFREPLPQTRAGKSWCSARCAHLGGSARLREPAPAPWTGKVGVRPRADMDSYGRIRDPLGHDGQRPRSHKAPIFGSSRGASGGRSSCREMPKGAKKYGGRAMWRYSRLGSEGGPPRTRSRIVWARPRGDVDSYGRDRNPLGHDGQRHRNSKVKVRVSLRVGR